MIGAQLQMAIFAALSGVAGGRIYDNPPEKAIFPYVTIGDETISNAGTVCGDAWTIYTDIHVWSRPETRSKIEVKTTVTETIDALLSELTIAGFTIVLQELESVRTLRDPDGITEHSVISFRYEIQPDS